MTKGETMTDADVRRSTPGYVYGVAGSYNPEMEPYTPKCSCACHLADAPSNHTSYWCPQCSTISMTASWPDGPKVQYSHDDAVADGKANPKQPMRHVLSHYFITKGNNLDDARKGRFKTLERAQAKADKLNSDDVIASLNLSPESMVRRERLKKLDHSSWYWGEGHPENRWPREPGRYAIQEEGWDGGSCWVTKETLGEVRETIAEGDVFRVVDLDTGKDVSFTRSVSVEFV